MVKDTFLLKVTIKSINKNSPLWHFHSFILSLHSFSFLVFQVLLSFKSDHFSFLPNIWYTREYKSPNDLFVSCDLKCYYYKIVIVVSWEMIVNKP